MGVLLASSQPCWRNTFCPSPVPRMNCSGLPVSSPRLLRTVRSLEYCGRMTLQFSATPFLFISVFIFIITSSILQIYFLCKHVRGFQQHRSQNCPAPGVLAALFVVLPRATHPFDTGSTRQQQGHSCDSYPDWWFWSIALITVVQHVVHLSFLVGRRERDRRKESDGWQWLN